MLNDTYGSLKANIEELLSVVEEQNDGEGGAQVEVLFLSVNGFCNFLGGN